MGKIDKEFIPDRSQSSVCSIEQKVCGDILHRPKPFFNIYL